jgi:hypothetical protein
MSKPSWVIVLAEDDCHQRFIRQFLYRMKFTSRQIHFGPIAGGRGSAEQWVRTHYAQHVQTYRERAASARTALIVVVDADTGTVENRPRQLAKALSDGGHEARIETEQILHLVPRRNIETWILCLTGEKVDEDTDYKRRTAVDELIKPASGTFFEWSRPNAQIPAHCVLSIEAAIPEIKRLD